MARVPGVGGYGLRWPLVVTRRNRYYYFFLHTHVERIVSPVTKHDTKHFTVQTRTFTNPTPTLLHPDLHRAVVAHPAPTREAAVCRAAAILGVRPQPAVDVGGAVVGLEPKYHRLSARVSQITVQAYVLVCAASASMKHGVV